MEKTRGTFIDFLKNGPNSEKIFIERIPRSGTRTTP
jgi:hypothetical protein